MRTYDKTTFKIGDTIIVGDYNDDGYIFAGEEFEVIGKANSSKEDISFDHIMNGELWTTGEEVLVTNYTIRLPDFSHAAIFPCEVMNGSKEYKVIKGIKKHKHLGVLNNG